MRALITSVYRFIYNLTRFKLFSLVIAIAYVSLLNLVMTYGLSLMLRDWLTPLGFLLKLFSFPVIIFTTGLMVYLVYRATPAKKTLAKDAKKSQSYTAILVYTGLCILVWVYIKYNDKVFYNPAVPARKRFKNPKNAFVNPPAPARMMMYPALLATV